MITAVLTTILVGYLSAATIGMAMNWPDAGAVFAVATMGAFLLHAMKKK